MHTAPFLKGLHSKKRLLTAVGLCPPHRVIKGIIPEAEFENDNPICYNSIMDYALKERIGYPDLFTGRKKSRKIFISVDFQAEIVYISTMKQLTDLPVNRPMETGHSALRIIRNTLALQKIEVEKIIFFGSRARGDFNSNSDWDFLILSQNDLIAKEKHHVIILIKRELAKSGIPNDIIIQSLRTFEEQKKYPGTLSYVANLEGVVTE